MGKLMPSSYPKSGKAFVPQAFEEGEDMSDNDLLEAIAGGDRNAFAVLMKRYLSGMVTLSQRIVFDREQAREIAQEAFLRVWQHAAKWDPYGTATFLTWLRLVVVNLSISRRRRYREQLGLDVIEEMPSGLADSFDHIAMSERKKIVGEAMQKLSERQRAAIALYYFDNLSQVEAAGIMKMTPRAFDSLIVRARVTLKKYLIGLGLAFKEDLT